MTNLRVLTKEEWDLIKETEYAKECSKLAYSKRIVCPDTIYEQFFNKEPIAKRLGKYRFTKAQYLINPPEVCDFHIDRYEPNPYYGNESKYVDKGVYYYDDKLKYYISKSLFSKPEYCYAAASFTRKESNWELHIYYDDVFNDPDFIEIAKYGFEQLKTILTTMKIMIDAEIEGSSEIILTLLGFLAIDFSEFNPESSFIIVEVEKNFIKKYRFNEINIHLGSLSESISIEGQWRFTFHGSAEYSILKELMEIIKPYVVGNDTWGFIFKDNFPIIYNGGLEYYPRIENEIKVIYES